jgi:hypothetical protein
VRRLIVVTLLAGLVLAGCAQRPINRTGGPPPAGQIATPQGSPSVTVEPVPEPPQPPPQGATGSGIAGRTVVDGCPVKRDPPCPDKPIAVKLEVLTSGALTALATVTSASDGTFRIALAPGKYQLRPATTGARWPKGETVEVTVETGRYTTVTVRLDSGIR